VNILDRLSNIDRRIVYLLIAAGTIIPILMPIGFPVSTTAPVENLFNKIESLTPDDVVLLSFDYGPTTAPENNPMSEAILRHCFERNVKVVAMALFPIGGATMAGEAVAKVTAEYPDLVYGVDYVNLGYKDGAQATMKQIGVDIGGVFPVDQRNTALADIPLMQKVHNYGDMDLIVSCATNIIGEWWTNLINAQFGIPVAVGTTAVSAPKYYAFLDSGQMLGLLGGLKGASEYESLIIDKYPSLGAIYTRPGAYTAMKGMDAQTVDHAIIMVFILFGNTIFFLKKRRDKKLEEAQGLAI
jgi:hypothetical protein